MAYGDIGAFFDEGALIADTIDTTAAIQEDTGEREPLPPGWYPCNILEAEVRKTKAGDGDYLNLKLEVAAGHKDAGRWIWDSIMLTHPKPRAVEIGHARLALLARAAKLARVNDSQAFVGKQVEARVVIDTKEYEGRKKNSVKEYRPVGAAPTTAPAAAPVAAPAPAPAPAPASPTSPDGQSVTGLPKATAPAAAPAAPMPPWLAGKKIGGAA